MNPSGKKLELKSFPQSRTLFLVKVQERKRAAVLQDARFAKNWSLTLGIPPTCGVTLEGITKKGIMDNKSSKIPY